MQKFKTQLRRLLFLVWLAALAAAVAVGGCGHKGDLTRPTAMVGAMVGNAAAPAPPTRDVLP